MPSPGQGAASPTGPALPGRGSHGFAGEGRSLRPHTPLARSLFGEDDSEQLDDCGAPSLARCEEDPAAAGTTRGCGDAGRCRRAPGVLPLIQSDSVNGRGAA